MFPPEKCYLTLLVSSKWIAGSLQPVMHPTTEDFVWSARAAIITTLMFHTLYSGLAGPNPAVLGRPMLLFLFRTTGRLNLSTLYDTAFRWSVCFKVNAICTYRRLSIIEKAHFQALAGDKKKKKTEGRRMTKKGEEEAEIIGKHPPTGIQVVTTEGMPIRRISEKATSFRKGSQSVNAPT